MTATIAPGPSSPTGPTAATFALIGMLSAFRQVTTSDVRPQSVRTLLMADNYEGDLVVCQGCGAYADISKLGETHNCWLNEEGEYEEGRTFQ